MKSVWSSPKCLGASVGPRVGLGVRGRRAGSTERRSIAGDKTAESASLIPATLDEMSNDKELQATLERLEKHGQQALTREEKITRQRSLDNLGAPSFAKVVSTPPLTRESSLQNSDAKSLHREAAKIFQLNIGLYCNQACTHCHVESSPKRTEMMDRATAERCIQLLKKAETVETLDITGGAPELNSEFRYLVEEASGLGVEIIDRCNLTVLLEPGQEDLAEFLAKHKVRVVASLPCYSEKNVNQQRGGGVFDRSIKGLQMLNDLGYGKEGTGLVLDLVYNPNGDFLAPDQATLQTAYKQELKDCYDIDFNSLFCLNNMPIKRFADFLVRRNKLEEYMQLLVDNFNSGAADGIMCRNTVSVGWDGRVFDCDFNQQLEIGVLKPGHKGFVTVFDIEGVEELTGWKIACDNHCFGCTAGAGSSCQGSTM